MAIRGALLHLLSAGPAHGYQLKGDFEAATGGIWSLNVGQVYTTLTRLERDGLVEQASGPDEEGRITYALTDTGRAEVDGWWFTPVDRSSTPRDELVIKLALSVTAVGVDVTRVVQAQRTATLRHLRDLTTLKRSATTESGTDLAWLLVLDNLVFSAEAEVRWLDHVESTLARYSTLPRRTPAAVVEHAPDRTEVRR